MIRDAEIERTLRRLSQPLLTAAGLGNNTVTIYIVQDQDLNAYVAGGNNIFLHTGLLRRLDTMDQLQSVIAHEIGHIAGGHLARRNQAMRGSRGVAGIGMLLAAAAAVAGSADAALLAGSISQEAALRNALAHTRAEEAGADQAGLRYMVSAGRDPQAILDVMRLFRGQELLSSRRVDPYVLTHPMWSQRINLLEDRVANAPRGKAPSSNDVYWYDRMVAKFDAFMDNPARVLRQNEGKAGEFATLSRAVAYHRLPNIQKAMQNVDALIALRPDDAYYNELKGQFLIESGKPVAAVAAYRKAVALAPNEPLILAGLGRALVAVNKADSTREALGVLEKSRQLDQANSAVLRDLALAYARSGQPGMASLVTSERYALQGRFRDAQIHAKRADGQLPEGSPGWRRAQDILRAAERVL